MNEEMQNALSELFQGERYGVIRLDGWSDTTSLAERFGYDLEAEEQAMRGDGDLPVPVGLDCDIADALEQGAIEYLESMGFTIIE